MPNPISPNVIRQALAWMGAPKPNLILPVPKTIEGPNGTTLSQVTLIFQRAFLLNWAMRHGMSPHLNNDTLITNALQECFCGDIIVVPLRRVCDRVLQPVILLTSVTARD